MSNTNNKSEKMDKSSDAEHLFVYATAKAGMKDVDKARIQQTIYEASKGSAYFQNEQRKAAQVEQRMKSVHKQLKQISNAQIEQMQMQCNKYLHQMDIERDVTRTWIHCDMDMFYAAVAMRDNPSLKDKPIAIGSMSMISTTNYIARKYGVRAAMPGFIGKKLCPQLLFVKHDWNAYKQASNKVRQIVAEYDPDFTAASLDEVYLDITHYLQQNKERNMSAADIAKEIRDKICISTQLTASAGVACNRMLSKIGSDINKPNGQFVLDSDGDKIKAFISTLNVRKIPGIGKVTQRILKEIGIETCAQCLAKAAYVKLFFKPSTYQWLLRACFGIGINKRDNEIHQRKSISQERTFTSKGIADEKVLEKKIIEICDGLCKEIWNKKIRGTTITVKLKTTEFETKTRAKNIGFYTNDKKVITNCAIQILRKEYPIKIRLLGVRFSGLEQKLPQSKLQKQITNFWSVKDNNNNNNDDGDNERKRKRKRNWNEMMENNDGDLDGNKRKKMRNYKENEEVNGVDIDCDDRKDDLNVNNKVKKPKMSISQMFEEQKIKAKKQQKYVCPICCRFECISNLDLNFHLDQCLQHNNKKKVKKKRKKANKTLTQFFTLNK